MTKFRRRNPARLSAFETMLDRVVGDMFPRNKRPKIGGLGRRPAQATLETISEPRKGRVPFGMMGARGQISRPRAGQLSAVPQRIVFEQLEARYLLSADLMPFAVDMTPDHDDVTLRFDTSSQLLRIFDSRNAAIIAEQGIDATDEVVVRGSDRAEKVRIEFDNDFWLPKGIRFDGGEGIDELKSVSRESEELHREACCQHRQSRWPLTRIEPRSPS